MSDTHGNRRLMHRVADAMAAAGAGLIIHLGDDYEDGEELRHAGHTVMVVPGLWCPAYRAGRVPKALRERVGGLDIACAHAPQDLGGPERRARLLMHGHTHVAMIEARGPAVWLNPGHLKRPHDRGQDASYALVHVEETRFRCVIHEQDGTRRLERAFPRAPGEEESAAP